MVDDLPGRRCRCSRGALRSAAAAHSFSKAHCGPVICRIPPSTHAQNAVYVLLVALLYAAWQGIVVPGAWVQAVLHTMQRMCASGCMHAHCPQGLSHAALLHVA